MIADSLSPQGDRLSTLEVVMPRIVLAEFNTHRMFSRNSASSRAIPFKKMVRVVEENPFIPIAWMKDHTGMQGTEYFTKEADIEWLNVDWLYARDHAVAKAKMLHDKGVTKQLCNRLLEPFMWHKVLVSATEWENFFSLRDHEAAEIHIQEVAREIRKAKEAYTPVQLEAGQWHIPYGDISTELIHYCAAHELNTSEVLLQIAVARCARLSYQTLGDEPKIDFEADLRVYDTLLKSGHYSPFEHVARAMTDTEYYNDEREIGLSDNRAGWCNNFRGFIQLRKLVA